ncbi:helix-turn-helix domain-containing protein [Desulfovibrio piger]|uniref:helix-turn-helix domain-containing protein n=1 Tax=Desulfovibrio piger TaxID=901 RepID=UPI0026232B9D|nr:helix-turn-helix domain-containing protein [Desulfovibrio piger]
METFAPKGNIYGPILPQFVLQMSITFGAKTMYAILCDYAADKDHCWPSQATLAKRLSCSISSVKNYIAELVREKLISIKREQYRSSVYYLLRPEELTKKQETHFADKQSEAGCHETKSGYLNNLSKQRKEKYSPLSPHMPGETVNPVRRMVGTPAAGCAASSLQDFESTWAMYPKKEAKGFARLAWLQLLRSGELPPLAELHAAIRRFASSESWQREQGRFVPQMGNWLRGQRWLDPVRPSGQTGQERTQDLRRAMQAREEREQRQHEAWIANKARLRPLFDAFAAKFPPVANDAMPFGIWLHLHSQDRAPSADDVPPGNTLSISEFLQDYKRRQTVEYRMQREAPLVVRKNGGNPCRSVGEILKGMGATFRRESVFGAPDFPITAYT